MKLSDPGFSIPLTIAYSRPSCPRNFLPAPNCEIADRVSRASLFLSNDKKANLPYPRLHMSSGSFASWTGTRDAYSRKVDGPPGCVPQVALQSSLATPLCPGGTAHDGLLTVLFQRATMLTLVNPEKRVPSNHPIRRIKPLAEAALKELSPLFEQMYSKVGRPSIPPERLLKASLLMALYTVRSERMLCEQLDYNLLFRWFLDMN